MKSSVRSCDVRIPQGNINGPLLSKLCINNIPVYFTTDVYENVFLVHLSSLYTKCKVHLKGTNILKDWFINNMVIEPTKSKSVLPLQNINAVQFVCKK